MWRLWTQALILLFPWQVPAKIAGICLTGHLRTAAGHPESFALPLQRHVLGSLDAAGYEVDVFAVTDAGEECAQVADSLHDLKLTILHCVDHPEAHEHLRNAEEEWLQFGPRTAWSRSSFLGQLKKVQICDDLFMATGKEYSLVGRSRMDIHWHRFPDDPTQFERPGVIWLPWRSSETYNQYITDTFAIGTHTAMKAYLRVYDDLLDQGNWPLHRSFENSSDGLDTEELWQVSLLTKGILARQHMALCFNLLARQSTDQLREREDNCRREAPTHPNGYLLDTQWFQLPYLGLSGFFRFDPLLTARLLHFWFAEWVRLGRPAKVMDLGCGRASMIERWLQYYPASIIGVDRLPGLWPILGDDFLELDLIEPIDLRQLTSTRACTFLNGDQDMARFEEAVEVEGLDMEMAFRNLLNCCVRPQCAGLSISVGLVPLDARQSEGLVDMIYLARRRNSSTWRQLAWAGRADWAFISDVLGHLPGRGLGALVQNLETLVAEGVVVSEPEDLLGEFDAALRARGFVRDRQSEELLIPLSMLRGVREDYIIRVFRRRNRTYPSEVGFPFAKPMACSLALRFSTDPDRCRLGLSFGCSNSEYMWVTDGCNGWFTRGRNQAGCLSNVENSTHSNWTYATVKTWQFVECFLPEGFHRPKVAQENVSTEAEAVLELCQQSNDFRDFHKVRVPLQKIRPGHWQSEEIFIGRYPMLQLRLSFDAVVHLNGMTDAWQIRGWHGPVLQRAGECVAWNLMPFIFYDLSFDIWDASSEEAQARLRSNPSGSRTNTFPLAWEAADAAVRANGARERGLLEIYEHIDPAAGWGVGHGGIWQTVGAASSEYRGRADSELFLLDGFAYLVLVVRIATAHVLGQVVPQGLLRAADVCRARGQTYSEGWSLMAMNLLTAVALEDDAGLVGHDHDHLVSLTDHPERFRLQFSNTPLGRYLHHSASFASSD